MSSESIGTASQQILLAPQQYNDSLPPQIGLSQKIRVPVYQEQTLNLTPYIYEDGGISDITRVWIDTDLAKDSDEDGNTQNDDDRDRVAISLSPAKIGLTFGPYEELFERNVKIFVEDNNGNIAAKEVPLEVYAPIPDISDISDNTIL